LIYGDSQRNHKTKKSQAETPKGNYTKGLTKENTRSEYPYSRERKKGKNGKERKGKETVQ